MPANKNALIRYKTIDRCLRNRYRRWTIEDLVRSDKLGYNAPIEVYDQRYYRYADPQYSITDMPLSEDDFLLIKRAVDLLGKNDGQPQNCEIRKVLSKVKNRLTAILNFA